MSGNFDPISLAIALALLALLPLAAVMTTSFLKLAVVFALVRNALGVQQVPPNMALYGLSLILSVYVMGPVVMQVGHVLRAVSTPAAQSATRSWLTGRSPRTGSCLRSSVREFQRW